MSLKVDIILLQETWLLHGNLGRLAHINNDYLSYGISGVTNEDLLYGRPYGGLGILWHKSHVSSIKPVQKEYFKTNRICAVEISSQSEKYLILNVYMPNDNMLKHHIADDFLTVCDEIEVALNEFSQHKIIIGGDLNIDFSRGP